MEEESIHAAKHPTTHRYWLRSRSSPTDIGPDEKEHVSKARRSKLQASRIVASATTTIAASTALRLSSMAEPSQNIAADENWRPTGRMRGSLTGAAYPAALASYASYGAAPATGIDSVNAHAPAAQQETSTKHCHDLGSESQGSSN